MRTTINLDDELLAEATEYTGISERTALIHEGLRANGLLNEGQVLSHLFVRGELACGNLKDRTETLRLHELLPQAVQVHDDEAIAFIDRRSLADRGLGWVDAHLLASSILTPDALLWTGDSRLAEAAEVLGVAFQDRKGVQ